MNLYTASLSFHILLFGIISPTLAAGSTATSFCKCICFANSTIIALNPPPSSTSAASFHNLDIRSPHALPADGSPETSAEDEPARPHRELTCADCTRAFCLDSDLAICKDAREEDVFTTCFQRDSLKDETVVVIFIFATAGLLAWAAVKPWVDRLRERNTFMPLDQQDRGQGIGGPGRPSKVPRRTRFGDTDGGGSSARGVRSNEDETFAVGEYDDDMHADQDAVDIVSDMPSSSGSRPGHRP
ncbi:hypothetical protein H2200_005816 [Cladophialophora chaetospira]|uniref:Integral membrane protein n=1 Tax=Cladophialophora chaetospira TaxID=386627 RepID=A0AA38X9R4_9EURO|nr:hypothetical protein H2200_005816 [Cladophialophora chaetospira]